MKKKVLIIFSMTILLFICGSIIDINIKKDKVDNLAINVSATPVTSHIVVIDAGHGKPDE